MRWLAALVVLAACSSATSNPPAGGSPLCAAPCTTDTTPGPSASPDASAAVTELGFTLDATQVVIAQKDWRDIGITVARPADIVEALALEAQNLPPGASATKVTVLQAQNRASVRISVGPNTPQGTYSLDITLRGSTKTVTNKLALEVIGAPGVIDTTFAAGPTAGRAVGKAELSVTGFARQPDGKLVVSGVVGASPARDFVAIRFSETGVPDATFGDAGLAKYDFGGDDYPFAMVSQSDGRLVTCGHQYDANVPSQKMLFARWTADGRPDTDFGTSGKVSLAPTQYAVCYNLLALPDDTLVGSGIVHNGTDHDFTLVKLSKGGVLDNTFGTGKNGYAKIDMGSNDYAFATAVEPNGNLVVTGERYNGTGHDLVAARFTGAGMAGTFGAVDKSWLNVVQAGTGQSFGWGIAVQSSGKIVVGGAAPGTDASDFVFVRHDVTGAIDTTFGTNGKTLVHVGANDRLWDLRLDSAGRILFVGSSDSTASSRAVVGRLLPDGQRDPAFGTGGIVALDFAPAGPDYGASLRLQNDGRILVAGTSLESGKNVPWITRLWP